MGFLTGLSEFAGGVSKGISQEAEDRARREQAKAAKLEREMKVAQERRDAKLAIDIGAAPVVGESSIGLGDVDYLLAKNQPPPVPEDNRSGMAKIGGALAGMFTARNTDRTAIAADLKPPPQPLLGVQPGTATPAAAAAVPAAATAPAPVRAAPEPQTPDTVPVAGGGGQLTRKATAIDRQLYLAKAYAEARQPDKAIEAYQKYGNMVIDRKLQAVDIATPAEIGNMMTAAVGGGKRYNVTQNPNNPEEFTLSQAVKGEDGKWVHTEILKNVSRGELKGEIGGYLGQDPEVKEKLISLSREQRMAGIEARDKAAKTAAQIAHYGASTEAVREGTLGARTTRERKTEEYNAEQFIRKPGSAILDPDRAEQIANDPAYTKMVKVEDPTTGAIVEKPYNAMREKIEAEKHDWMTSEWSRPDRAIVRRVKNEKGEYGFAVLGPDGNYIRD
ncbi:MAG: hypothetical protein EHM24_28260, partial [Acidobacteria bacterium]